MTVEGKVHLHAELHSDAADTKRQPGSVPGHPMATDDLGESFPATLSALFAQAEAAGLGWRLQFPTSESEVWLNARRTGVQMPDQGWKLHISATPLSADEVLRRVVPLLLSGNANFKVVSSRRNLIKMNSG